MLADDFSTMRRVIKILLHKNGCTNVLEADDGQSALEQCASQQVGLVIADFTMPRMSGWDLLQALRKSEDWASLPFLMMMTDEEKTESGAQVKDMGAEVITKPFTAEVLAQKMREMLK